jgi:hypothetical protein
MSTEQKLRDALEAVVTEESAYVNACGWMEQAREALATPSSPQAEAPAAGAESSEPAAAEAQAVPSASIYAAQRRLAVSEEWMRGWNACLDAHDVAHALATKADSTEPMIDMTPPATSRDRWMYQQGRLAEREDQCALIKAADDAAADNDYMLDSNDCISVIRGTWKSPLANDFPKLADSTDTQAPIDDIRSILYQADRGNVSLSWLIDALWGIALRATPVPEGAKCSGCGCAPEGDGTDARCPDPKTGRLLCDDTQAAPEGAMQAEPVAPDYCTAYHCAGDCGLPHNQEERIAFTASQPEALPANAPEETKDV